ncbi:serine O-acetyltransferase [Acinetobacter sp. ANC 5383]
MTLDHIKSDLYRYTGNTTFKSFLKQYFLNRGFNFLFWLRLASFRGIVGKLAYPVYFHKKIKYGLDVSHKMKLGYGLYIGHGGPLIINPTAILGNNINLSQYTTIGSNDGLAAEIGDNVYIGPNVCIVENVKIGDNVVIGAGSIVTKDIPSNSTAAGNYAKVLNSNPNMKYVHNRWTI